MAVIIDIKKTDETEQRITFEYSMDRSTQGVFTYDKANGDYTLVHSSGDEKDHWMFSAACYRVRKALEAGAVPDTLAFMA